MTEPIKPAVEFNVGWPMGQFRFVPFALGAGERGFLVVGAGCAEDDPARGMFFLPTDTLKLTAFSADGKRLWHRDLGAAMIPGIWFCPVLPFDLDGDGVDDIWFVNNTDADHPLHYESFVLERASASGGETIETRPWPPLNPRQSMSALYRNFINGAYARGEARLVTCQGTYADMQLQCRDASLEPVWTRRIEREAQGARGSHMSPVVDIDADGRDELLWGERCIDLDTGRDVWVGDLQGYRGHSDVIQPTLDRKSGRWSVYTCRESPAPSPDVRGVVLYDDQGREVWGRRRMGHIDMGWTARLADGGGHLCYALQIGAKSAGPGGFKRGNVVEYLFDMAGHPLRVEFPLFMSLPVDFNGDGLHELVYMGGERQGLVIDRTGEPLYELQGEPAYAGKLLEAPGEQIVTWSEDGTVRLYTCPEAEDTPAALARYSHPYYAACLRIWAVGYNKTNLGGL